MPVTRAMSLFSPSMSSASELPSELWVEILSYLPPSDLGRALTSCKSLASLSNLAWRAACFRCWPRWAAIAAEPGAQWRRQYELLSLRDSEAGTVADVAAIRKLQQQVSERHRTILTEWLCEVSFDWGLDSTVVFKATAYLDFYLSRTKVEALSRFQLLGLSCLRAAMGDARTPAKIVACCEDKSLDLDAQRFAYISDDTYTPAEVEEFTQVIAGMVPSCLKTSPNAKMFLRSFWYRGILKEVVHKDEMHIYTFASFLLQLSLLDLPCSAFTASKLAAGALSVALAAFGKEEWPVPLQQFGSYPPEELADCKARLVELQAMQAATQLRSLWRQFHENHSYDEYKPEWDRLLRIFARCSPLVPAGALGMSPIAELPATPVDTADDMQVD